MRIICQSSVTFTDRKSLVRNRPIHKKYSIIDTTSETESKIGECQNSKNVINLADESWCMKPPRQKISCAIPKSSSGSASHTFYVLHILPLLPIILQKKKAPVWGKREVRWQIKDQQQTTKKNANRETDAFMEPSAIYACSSDRFLTAAFTTKRRTLAMPPAQLGSTSVLFSFLYTRTSSRTM